MSETTRTCPVCRKDQPVGDAAFCPFCGASLAVPAPVPESVKKTLEALQKTDDPVKKHKLLMAAREECPDQLDIEREILFLGRLHERNAKSPSFDVIKCFLLHFYLTPENFSPEKKAQMRRELFEDEQLKRCQALAPDAAAFTAAYLKRLSGEFIRLFLEGSNYYMHSIFGFTMKKNTSKLLAAPASTILSNIRKDGELSQEQRDMLMNAFFAAFAQQMDNDTSHLLKALEEKGCTLPA